jgi:hypothetical protein
MRPSRFLAARLEVSRSFWNDDGSLTITKVPALPPSNATSRSAPLPPVCSHPSHRIAVLIPLSPQLFTTETWEGWLSSRRDFLSFAHDLAHWRGLVQKIPQNIRIVKRVTEYVLFFVLYRTLNDAGDSYPDISQLAALLEQSKV